MRTHEQDELLHHDVERGRHDKEARMRALLDAATATFARMGYEAATTRQVAEAAGVSEGLIHRYFGGKQGLLMAVIAQRAEFARREFENVPRCDELLPELEVILELALEHGRRYQDHMRVTMCRALIDPDLGRNVGQLFSEARAARVRERLERHRALGNIAPGYDLDAISHAITGMGFASGFIAQICFGVPRERVEHIARELAAVLAAGLSQPPSPTTPEEGP